MRRGVGILIVFFALYSILIFYRPYRIALMQKLLPIYKADYNASQFVRGKLPSNSLQNNFDESGQALASLERDYNILSEEYRDLLTRSSNSSSSESRLLLIHASPIYHDFDGFREYLILDTGFSDGVTEGDAVVTNGHLIGYSSSVSRRASSVTYAYTLGSESIGILPSGEEIRLRGLGLQLYESIVPKELTVNTGDVVITDFSSRFIIGEVLTINEKPALPVKTLIIRSMISPVLPSTLSIIID
jgi:cell shape-determining protein MreC